MRKLFVIVLISLINTQVNAQCWQSIATAYSHTIAIKSDGTLWSWGSNGIGQLGDGTTIDKNTPIQIGNENNWLKISCGYDHTTAIKTDGTLWAWGNNYYGQLGDGTNISKYIPVQIGIENNWQSIDSGNQRSFAIKNNGTLWAWGLNSSTGALGDGTTIDKNIPTQIGNEVNWKTVSAGTDHNVAIKINGTLWAWGNNAQGALGDNGTSLHRSIPTQIGTDSNWKSASAGFLNNSAIKINGTLWTWGYNEYGQLGDGTIINRNFPIQIGNETDWNITSTGSRHATALKNNNTIWAWGQNQEGQLGNNTTVNENTPHQIGNETNWTSITAGYYHNVAIKTDITLWAWGQNQEGQLGDGTNLQKNQPVQISCTGLATNELNPNNIFLSIFPNPSNEFIYIQKSDSASIDKITIIDINGKQIFEQIDDVTEINIQQLQEGIYLLKVFIKGEILQQKFIKK